MPEEWWRTETGEDTWWGRAGEMAESMESFMGKAKSFVTGMAKCEAKEPTSCRASDLDEEELKTAWRMYESQRLRDDPRGAMTNEYLLRV